MEELKQHMDEKMADMRAMLVDVLEKRSDESVNTTHSIGLERATNWASVVSEQVNENMNTAMKAFTDNLQKDFRGMLASAGALSSNPPQGRVRQQQHETGQQNGFYMYPWPNSQGACAIRHDWEFSRNCKAYEAWRVWFGGLSPSLGTLPLRNLLLTNDTTQATQLRSVLRSAETSRLVEMPEATTEQKERAKKSVQRDITNAMREWRSGLLFLEELGLRNPSFDRAQYDRLLELLPSPLAADQAEAQKISEALWYAAMEYAENAVKNPKWFRKVREHEIKHWGMRTLAERVHARQKYMKGHPHEVEEIMRYDTQSSNGPQQADEHMSSAGDGAGHGGDVEMDPEA